jgi:hypothetical protein
MSAMIAAHVAETLVGRRVRACGGNYLVPCPAHEDRSPSLSLKDGEGGLLLINCFAGCNPMDVLAAIRDRLGGSLELHAPPQPRPPNGSDAYEQRQHEKAAWLWSRRRPIKGSIAERYLREARGYPADLPLPPTLAFLPPSRPEHHPALIAAFGLCDEPEPGLIAAPRHVDAVHLVLLKGDGSGKANKPDKLTIGRPLGRPIVIAPVNNLPGLAITEGIEDALSVFAGTGLGAWASASAPFLPTLADAVPGYVECVTIYAHGDPAGETNARRLAAALRKRGIETILEGLS